MTTVRMRGVELVENIKDITVTRYLSGIYSPCGGEVKFKLKLSRGFSYDTIGMYLA